MGVNRIAKYFKDDDLSRAVDTALRDSDSARVFVQKFGGDAGGDAVSAKKETYSGLRTYLAVVGAAVLVVGTIVGWSIYERFLSLPAVERGASVIRESRYNSRYYPPPYTLQGNNVNVFNLHLEYTPSEDDYVLRER